MPKTATHILAFANFIFRLSISHWLVVYNINFNIKIKKQQHFFNFVFVQVSELKNGVYSYTVRTKLVHPVSCLFVCFNKTHHSTCCVFWQLFTDFLEIHQEIEAETERGSGNNKVKNIYMYILMWYSDAF